ncbi:hypothetical protein BH11PSE7_BH11PSE7_18280 [soil metagenome]
MTSVSNAAQASHAAAQKSAAPQSATRDGENSFGALMGKLTQHADAQAGPHTASPGAQAPERRDTGHASMSDADSTAKRLDAPTGAMQAAAAAPYANAAQAASEGSNATSSPTPPAAVGTAAAVAAAQDKALATASAQAKTAGVATTAALAAAARATAADSPDAASATAPPGTDATGADSAQILSTADGADAATAAAVPPVPGAPASLTLPALIAMLMPGAALTLQVGAADKSLAGGKVAPGGGASGVSSAAGGALAATGTPGTKSAAQGQDAAADALAAPTQLTAPNQAAPDSRKPDLSDAASGAPRDKLTDAAALTSSTAPLAPPLQAAMPAPDFNRLLTDAQAGVYQATLPSRPHEAAFAGDLSAEVKMLMDGGLQRAELRLNPSDLGPIQIQLSITAQTADISFHAAHSQTREGIEQALPALRDMLAAQGLSLGQAGVSSGQEQRQGSDAANAQAGAGEGRGNAGRGGTVTGSSSGAAPVQLRALRGMLDMYA